MVREGTNTGSKLEALATLLVVLVVVAFLTGMQGYVRKSQERWGETESTRRLGAIGMYMVSRVTSKGGSFDIFPYNGKSFVLAPIAYGDIDQSEPTNFEIFFSPRDGKYTLAKVDRDLYLDLERYAAINKETLRTGDFHELTSWAGRRNADPRFRITRRSMKRRTIILCDDDDGPLHHPGGLIVCWSDGKAHFMAWEELDMEPPDDRDRWLGPAARTEALRALSSR